jgi:hypothetical protein
MAAPLAGRRAHSRSLPRSRPWCMPRRRLYGMLSGARVLRRGVRRGTLLTQVQAWLRAGVLTLGAAGRDAAGRRGRPARVVAQGHRVCRCPRRPAASADGGAVLRQRRARGRRAGLSGEPRRCHAAPQASPPLGPHALRHATPTFNPQCCAALAGTSWDCHAVQSFHHCTGKGTCSKYTPRVQRLPRTGRLQTYQRRSTSVAWQAHSLTNRRGTWVPVPVLESWSHAS